MLQYPSRFICSTEIAAVILYTADRETHRPARDHD